MENIDTAAKLIKNPDKIELGSAHYIKNLSLKSNFRVGPPALPHQVKPLKGQLTTINKVLRTKFKLTRQCLSPLLEFGILTISITKEGGVGANPSSSRALTV